MQFDRRRHHFNMTQERVVVTVRSRPCQPKTQQAQQALTDVMQNFINDPRLMSCGDGLFDTSRLTHDGQSWVWIFESLEPRKDLNV